MAETTARQMIVSILLFGGIITGCFVFISAFISDTNSNFNEYNQTFNKFDTIKGQSEDVQEVIETADPQVGILGAINGLVQSSWGSLKLIFTSVGTMGTILSDLSSMLGIPVWFTGMLIAIIGIVVTFAIMAAVFKWHI